KLVACWTVFPKRTRSSFVNAVSASFSRRSRQPSAYVSASADVSKHFRSPPVLVRASTIQPTRPDAYFRFLMNGHLCASERFDFLGDLSVVFAADSGAEMCKFIRSNWHFIGTFCKSSLYTTALLRRWL